MNVYYAHCLAIYNTPQEKRDLITLQRLGFQVTNPNSPIVQRDVELLRGAGQDYMEYFRLMVEAHQALAFRALPDGTIPSGVAKEIFFAHNAFIPVFELPSAISRRSLSLQHTREYLREIGQR